MNRLFLALAGFFGASGVILGSLASHAFKATLTEPQIAIFKLGVQYQMYHALALLGVAAWLNYAQQRLIMIAGILFGIGILFFSGTMYSITYLALPNIGTAPIGGIALILGWLCLLLAACRK